MRIMSIINQISWQDRSGGKELGHGLDGPGSNPGVGGVEIFSLLRV